MTIAGQLARWRSPFAVMPGLNAVHTQEALRDLEQRFAGVSVRKPEDFALEKVWERLVEARNNGNDLEGLDRRTLRHGPWVMFVPWREREPLGADEGFVRAYLKRLRCEPVGAAVLSLAAAFLHDYPKQLRTFTLLCHAIPVLLGRSQSRRCRVLTGCVDRVGLFNAKGPKTTWERLCNDQQPLPQALTGCCLTGSLGSGRFAEEVFLSAISSARNQIRNWNREAVDRLLGFAIDDDEARLRFPAQRVALAEGLLMPFAGIPAEKSAEVQKIQAFLIAHYGDPRLTRAKWQGVNEESIQVVLGWLVEDTLEDFFRLLEYTAQGDEVASRHWRFRKAFWSAYLRAGLIQDAWVVLAHQVDADARHRLNMDRKDYGRFARGGGIQRNQAVLIMRIGHLVITEWSHSGKFRIWNEGQTGTSPPRFYQPHYTRGQLVNNASHEGSHGGSEHGTWQRRLASYIHDATGIKFRHAEFFPAGYEPPPPRATTWRPYFGRY